VANINAQARDISQVKLAVEETAAIISRAHGGADDFEVFSRAERMKEMDEQGRVYDVTFMVCGTISLLVGGIVIMNILLASFSERVREVAPVRRSVRTG